MENANPEPSQARSLYDVLQSSTLKCRQCNELFCTKPDAYISKVKSQDGQALDFIHEDCGIKQNQGAASLHIPYKVLDDLLRLTAYENPDGSGFSDALDKRVVKYASLIERPADDLAANEARANLSKSVFLPVTLAYSACSMITDGNKKLNFILMMAMQSAGCILASSAFIAYAIRNNVPYEQSVFFCCGVVAGNMYGFLGTALAGSLLPDKKK